MKIQKEMATELAGDYECTVCLDLLHQPVTLAPCLHSFCGGCFSEVVSKSFQDTKPECPNCRKEVDEVKRNP